VHSWLDTNPQWHRKSRPRLAASIAIATVLTTAFITLTTFRVGDEQPVEFDVFIVPPVSPVAPEPVVDTVELPKNVETIEDDVAEVVADTVPEAVPEEAEEPQTDWYAQMESVVATVVSEQQKTYALNPVQDTLRREAAEQFRPSRAPVRKEIWENVEVDQLGRKILVSGDCYRVIDDPSASRRYDFLEFYQFIVFCSDHKRRPQELPWVEEVRERYVYLQPDVPHDDTRTDMLAELQ
jgi:hypothetical protein